MTTASTGLSGGASAAAAAIAAPDLVRAGDDRRHEEHDHRVDVRVGEDGGSTAS